MYIYVYVPVYKVQSRTHFKLVDAKLTVKYITKETKRGGNNFVWDIKALVSGCCLNKRRNSIVVILPWLIGYNSWKVYCLYKRGFLCYFANIQWCNNNNLRLSFGPLSRLAYICPENKFSGLNHFYLYEVVQFTSWIRKIL